MILITAEEADAACEGFHRAHPNRSAKRVLTWAQAGVLVAIIIGLGLAASSDYGAATAQAALLLAYVLFALTIAARLFAASNLGPLTSRIDDRSAQFLPTYTLLCPLHREAGVVADLVAALERLNYPREALDIKLLVESDDLETVRAALAAARGRGVEVLIAPPCAPRTKPKALNLGLAHARGSYLAVYDAEDRPHPLQLRAALATFVDGGADLAALQAPLTPDNGHASWIAAQFAAEYAIQFRELLPTLARMGLPFPLGGSSNHFRVDALKAVGGWDPNNVTEDLDLGYRLAREGWRAGVIAPPTWEEAPIGFRTWLKQRTRWIKGHLQSWLVLMRNPLRTAREMGWRGFIAMQFMLGGGLAASLLHGPMAAMVVLAFASPADLLGLPGFVLALTGYCVGVFAALSAAALSGDASHARAALTMPLYWPLASIAALCALFELLLRPHHWAKTEHGLSARRLHPELAEPRTSTASKPAIASMSRSA